MSLKKARVPLLQYLPEQATKVGYDNCRDTALALSTMQ